jgi:serine/threonine protein kinase
MLDVGWSHTLVFACIHRPHAMSCMPALCCAQGTVVAIKRLLIDDSSTIERFVSEVRLLARLRHPNLILFMGYCITPELCIVSEFMSKGSLYGVLHSAEQRKQRMAAMGGTQLAGEDAGCSLGSHGSGATSEGAEGSSQQQTLQGQPSLAEGQLPLAEEVR